MQLAPPWPATHTAGCANTQVAAEAAAAARVRQPNWHLLFWGTTSAQSKELGGSAAWAVLTVVIQDNKRGRQCPYSALLAVAACRSQSPQMDACTAAKICATNTYHHSPPRCLLHPSGWLSRQGRARTPHWVCLWCLRCCRCPHRMAWGCQSVCPWPCRDQQQQQH